MTIRSFARSRSASACSRRPAPGRCTRTARRRTGSSNLESFVGPIIARRRVRHHDRAPHAAAYALGFSESAIIAPYEDGRGFMFRIVNLRPSDLSDVHVARQSDLVRGDRRRSRAQPPRARRSSATPSSCSRCTGRSSIRSRSSSPLAGITPEKLAAAQAEFLVFVTALEETFSTRVTTRTSYLWDEAALGREVREHLRERSGRRDRDRRRAPESHRASRRRRDAHSGTRSSSCHPDERGQRVAIACSGAHGLEIELLLEIAQHFVRDRPFVAQTNEHSPLGGDHSEPEAAATRGLPP